MLILRRPSSSAKSGCSHPIGNTASRVACGRMNRLPPVTSSSTILLTVTAPIRHFIAASIGCLSDILRRNAASTELGGGFDVTSHGAGSRLRSVPLVWDDDDLR